MSGSGPTTAFLARDAGAALKIADALLKVGFCYQSLGQPDKAKAVLEQVVSLYPKTEPAALAAKRLETP